MIKNYRNFLQMEISDLPAQVVFVGENGVGKSNLLRAVRLVLDPDLPDSARYLPAEDICEQSPVGLAGGVEVRVEVELTGFDDDLDARSALDGCIIATTPLTARLTYSYHPIRKAQGGEKLTRDDYNFDIFGAVDESKDARNIRRTICMSVLGALRDVESELARTRRSPVRELLDSAPPETSVLQAAATEINRAKVVLSQDKNIKTVSRGLESRVRSMTGPRMAVSPTLGFASSAPAELMSSIKLFIDAECRRSVTDTSTGTANVLYLALLLDRLAMRRAKDRLIDTVLAVEEPEAHLHPVLQRKLFRYLLHQSTPLLLTTHSPHIAAIAPLDSLVLLQARGNQGTVATRGPRIGVVTAQEQADIERYLDVSRAEALFCSAMVLVEGTTEVFLIPLLANALGFDLDSYGVVVGSVAGFDFEPYRKLLGTAGFQIPHVVITDGDRYVKGGFHGLQRAAGLLPPGADRDKLEGHVTVLCPPPKDTEAPPADSSVLEQRRSPEELQHHERAALTIAANYGVFIGRETLELDLAPLIGEAMISACRSFDKVSDQLATAFEDSVRAMMAGNATDEQRTEILRRIESISKGRFAQRLATVLNEEGTSAISQLATKEIGSNGHEDLGQLMLCAEWAYIVLALDHIARIVRGRGLFPILDQGSSEAPSTAFAAT